MTIVLGVLHVGLFGWAWHRPGQAAPVWRRFPRNVPVGIGLMLLGTAWFFLNLYRSNLDDFREWRPIIYAAIILIGLGNCFFVRDYIAVRGLGVVLLLGCDVLLDAQRFHPSPLKFPLPLWCYLMIVLSVWWVMSPWRLRDAVNWATVGEGRMRRVGLVGMAWGGALIALGALALR
jgi:hypothetical protein